MATRSAKIDQKADLIWAIADKLTGVASMLEGKQMGESGFFANSSDAMPALYEKMLKTSVEGPERIKDIGYVLKMVTDKDIIPDEFRELYETFCNTLKIRR